MLRRAMILALALLAWAPTLAKSMPGAIVLRGQMMARTCVQNGGRVGPGERPFAVNDADFNGDGRADWLIDAAAFQCLGKPSLFSSANGSIVEVLRDDGRGGARSAFLAAALTYQVARGSPATLTVTQQGAKCAGGGTCQKSLTWSRDRFVETQLAQAPANAAPAPAQASGAFAGAPFTVTPAEKIAAFKAAGFKQVGGKWAAPDCNVWAPENYSPSASVFQEAADLNKDGRPEFWIRNTGTGCYGNTGEAVWLMGKTATGWVTMIQQVGVADACESRHNGWPDVLIGGPGMGPFSLYAFNGAKYVDRQAYGCPKARAPATPPRS